VPLDDIIIEAALGELTVRLAPPGAAVPPLWTDIVAATDPAERVRLAVARWNRDFLALIPTFADALRTRFVDVRHGTDGDLPVLVYVAESKSGGYVTWVGYDPATFGTEPKFWEHFPGPLRTFLRDVHAGFVSYSWMSFGPMRPDHMQTIAELADFPDGVPGFDDEAEIGSTRLLPLCNDGGLLYYCVSPELAAGRIALVYEGDVDPKDFGPEFDEMLTSRLNY
jgi:hypothetical protein